MEKDIAEHHQLDQHTDYNGGEPDEHDVSIIVNHPQSVVDPTPLPPLPIMVSLDSSPLQKYVTTLQVNDAIKVFLDGTLVVGTTALMVTNVPHTMA